MDHGEGKLHSCGRFFRFGMDCPFVGGEEPEQDEDAKADPVVAEALKAFAAKAGISVARASEQLTMGAFAEAETAVAAAADVISVERLIPEDAFPNQVRQPVSLARAIAEGGKVLGPIAAAAASGAIKLGAKKVTFRSLGIGGLHRPGGFAGGGRVFESVIDPRRAARVR